MCFDRCIHPPNYTPIAMWNIPVTPAAATVLRAEVDLGETPQLDPRPLLRLPLTPQPLEQVAGTCRLPGSPASPLLCPGPLASAPVPPPITTHEGRVHLRRDKFPTLFLVVNCLDPPWYLALGCLSCGQALWLCRLGHFLSEKRGTAREGSLLLWAVTGISTRDTA